MKREECWKKEFEQYKIDLLYLRKALECVQKKKEEDPVVRQLLSGGVMQSFCMVLYRSGMVMNEYMGRRGQGKSKSLKNIFAKAFDKGLIVHKRWLEIEHELTGCYQVETLQEALKMERKIRKIYLPLLEKFEVNMEMECQPTLFG